MNAMTKKYTRRNMQGFSFVELMVVIALIGILSAIALPSFLRSLPEKRLKNAARNMFVDLQKARLLAVKENTNVTVTFNTAAGAYSSSPGGVAGTLADYGAVRYGCDIASADWNNPANTLAAGTKTTFTDDAVLFRSRGTAEMDNGSGDFVLLAKKNGEGVILQSENDQTVCYAVTISGVGTVRIYRYNGSAWE